MSYVSENYPPVEPPEVPEGPGNYPPVEQPEEPTFYQGNPSLKSVGLAALILGIIGFVVSLVPILGFPLGVVAIILGILAYREASRGGTTGPIKAIWGIVLGSLAIIVSILSAILGVVILNAFDDIETKDTPAVTAPADPTDQTPMDEVPAPEGTVTPEPAPEPLPEEGTVTPDVPEGNDSGTVSQQNALEAAENYLKVIPFSRVGLENQLTVGNGFSEEDANYAVGQLNVDWNEQASRSAKNYLNVIPFSRADLLTQLTSDGYSPEEAEFGVSQSGL